MVEYLYFLPSPEVTRKPKTNKIIGLGRPLKRAERTEIRLSKLEYKELMSRTEEIYKNKHASHTKRIF